MPPPPEVSALCDSIDDLIKAYLRASEKGTVKLGRFEAEAEAYTLQKLIIRHAEAVVLMARHDLVYLPSAHVTSRAAFEAHVKMMWMLKPIDPFEQECRWVMHLKSASEHFTKLAKGESLDEAIRSQCLTQSRVVEGFAGEVTTLLSAQGYSVPAKPATVWDMLKELDLKHLYPAYVQLSAYTHSNFEAVSLYRKNLGCGKELGEFISPMAWAFPIETVWRSLFVTSRRVLALIEAPEQIFPSSDLAEDFELRLDALQQIGPQGTGTDQ
jgi:hypothetical protein